MRIELRFILLKMCTRDFYPCIYVLLREILLNILRYRCLYFRSIRKIGFLKYSYLHQIHLLRKFHKHHVYLHRLLRLNVNFQLR